MATGGYEALLTDVRAHIRASDPALAESLGLADARHSTGSRSSKDTAVAQTPSRFGQTPSNTEAPPPPVKHAVVVVPSKALRIQRARDAVKATMAKAMTAFEAGQLTGHEVSKLETASADYLADFVARLR